MDVEAHRALARRSAERDPDWLIAGRGQNAAIAAAGDRRAELARVTAPTLVVHGDADVVIRPEGGEATAAAIPGAELWLVPGLGHEFPQPLWQPVADRIAALAGRPTRDSVPPAQDRRG